MRDLGFANLSFDNFELEALDVLNDRHVEILNTFRDKTALEMCYDVMTDVRDEMVYKCCQGTFLAKNDEGYFGYVYISDNYEGQREMAYIIQENVRKKGLGTIMVTSISDFLLSSDLANSVYLFVRPDNVAGIKLATKCGFIRGEEVDNPYNMYSKRLIVKR